jgi:hypothetical protein
MIIFHASKIADILRVDYTRKAADAADSRSDRQSAKNFDISSKVELPDFGTLACNA